MKRLFFTLVTIGLIGSSIGAAQEAPAVTRIVTLKKAAKIAGHAGVLLIATISLGVCAVGAGGATYEQICKDSVKDKAELLRNIMSGLLYYGLFCLPVFITTAYSIHSLVTEIKPLVQAWRDKKN